ncbi:MAG: hypothetical protein CMH49_09725, partial [Myxococcales bacterium]|nr:hypothetical protein [Myxococcales bacterium]
MMNTHKALSLHVSRFAQFGAWGMVLALLAACGSIPPPPSVPAFPAEEPNTKGIPSAAFTSFETGVKALEEKPANFIDAAKSFEEALNTYEASRNRQIKARENHKQELVQNEKALEAWKALHGKKLAEEPDLKKQLAQREEALKNQRAALSEGIAAPDYVVARLNFAYTREKLGRYEEAVKAYKVLLDKNVADATIRLAYGRSLLLSGQAKDSISQFEAVLAADKRSLDARNNLAAAYLKLNDLETCLNYVKEVLSAQPKNVSAIINLGLLYLKDKKYDLAELMFKKAIKYDKINARAYSNLGLTYYQTNKLPFAVINFEKAIGLDPSMDEARLNLGSVYLDYLDYARALEQFNIVLSRFPMHYQALVGAADSLYGTSEYKEAIDHYLESMKIRDTNTEVLLRLARLYEEKMSSQADHKDVAVGYYERLIKISKPAKGDPIHMQLANLKAIIQMEKDQKNNPPPPVDENPVDEEPTDQGATEAPADQAAAEAPADQAAAEAPAD